MTWNTTVISTRPPPTGLRRELSGQRPCRDRAQARGAHPQSLAECECCGDPDASSRGGGPRRLRQCDADPGEPADQRRHGAGDLPLHRAPPPVKKTDTKPPVKKARHKPTARRADAPPPRRVRPPTDDDMSSTIAPPPACTFRRRDRWRHDYRRWRRWWWHRVDIRPAGIVRRRSRRLDDDRTIADSLVIVESAPGRPVRRASYASRRRVLRMRSQLSFKLNGIRRGTGI